MKFAFFGTPDVASETLDILHEQGYTPSLIVTNPDAVRGRGLTLTPTEVKTWAIAHDIPVITPDRLDGDVEAETAKYQCDYAVVVAYGKIFPEVLIHQFPKGVFNIHYSLLPKYRGATPVETALLRNEHETGVTVQRMVYELDAGDILAQEKIPVEITDTATTLRSKLIPLGAHTLISVLDSLEADTLKPTPQDHELALNTKKLTKQDGLLDHDLSDIEKWNQYRAHVAGPGTYFFARRGTADMRVKLTDATYEDGVFIIRRVIPEGKKEMDYQVFMDSLTA